MSLQMNKKNMQNTYNDMNYPSDRNQIYVCFKMVRLRH